MATLTVTEDTDFRGGPAETDITDIVFQAANPGISLKATFEPGQFGPGLISETVTVTDDPGHANTFIEVEFAGPGSFSAAGWTFVDWELGDQIYIFGTADAQTITGSAHDDRIGGYGGVDQIDAGGGDDSILTTFGVAAGSTIEGGAGFDTLQVGQTRDLTEVDISGVERLFFEVATTTVILNGDQIGAGGISELDGQWSQTGAIEVEGDTVDFSAVSFLDWGSDDSVTIRGTSTFSNALTGSGQADTIVGTSASIDFMTGGGGADTLEGGDGPDAFIYFSGADLVAGETIDGGEGSDTFALISAGSIDFGAATHVGVETVDFISGSSTAMLTSIQVGTLRVTAISGSSSADHLVVTAISEFANLSGLSFADWTAGTDTITVNGSDLGDYLLGSSQPDTIFGEEGGDRIDGGAGADAMLGGNDNDTYMVDNSGDTASESGGSGTDEVQSTISFAIRTDVENLTLLGAGAINGTGNVSANTITGNSAANTLTAFGGADRLDGGGGADTMIGGNGDDTYVVDNAGDTASEASGSGIDTLQSTVTFTLAAGIENLILNGTAAINGTGNGAANVITGNSAANVLSGLGADDTVIAYGGADRLDGGTGADTMIGGHGDDTYVVDNAGDTASEASGSGIDTVQSTVTFTLVAGVENIVLNGASAINGTGSAGANTLYGNSAANRLDGDAGSDTMTGFGGADAFVFADGDGADTVTDFQNGSDICDLSGVAGVDEFSDLGLTDTGAGVEVDYGTGSFELANVANLSAIDAGDFVFA